MPNLEDDQDGAFALRRVPGRFYVSRRFPQGGEDSGIVDPKICRFAYQVVDEHGEVVFESEQGWEVILRDTPTRQQLKALFFEDDRSVQYMSFQRFNSVGERLRRESFILSGREVEVLASFLGLIRSESLDLAERDGGIRLLPEGVDALLTDDTARIEIFRRYRSAFTDLFEADVESPEIVAFARRRQELQVFEALLNDDQLFDQRRMDLSARGRRSGAEGVWQDFFESNQWIFGTGLAPQFLHAWDPDRLEQTVVGASVFGRGKRPDALMQTAGAISALVFVEIKTHITDLLHPTEYRPGTWRPSEEVAGGISQCQASVDEAVRHAQRELEAVDRDGFPTGERAVICRPRSLLVVGSLGQFIRDGRPNLAMFESFERFRRSLRDPEIVTFDELFARAAMSLALSKRDDPASGSSRDA
jgi:Domain of unknown function (DUF4263)